MTTTTRTRSRSRDTRQRGRQGGTRRSGTARRPEAAPRVAKPSRRYGLDTAIKELTPAERAEKGRKLRERVPRSSHAEFSPGAQRPDPVALLMAQSAGRMPDLVPIRYGRMLASPFSYFRGAALPMARDLSATPVTGLVVQACGDAHLGNFGLFGSAERRLVFDINDFDETLPGPWEWDVKRLAASLEIAARDNGIKAGTRRSMVQRAVRRYRLAMAEFAGQPNLAVWYASADVESVRQRLAQRLAPQQSKRLAKGVAKARTKDSMN